MKRLSIIIASIATASALYADVKIPFNVPDPTWELLATAKEGCAPLIFMSPNASSKNIVVWEGPEESTYRWESPSMYLNEGEMKFTIGTYNVFPVKSFDQYWANLEFIRPEDNYSGWTQSSELRQVKTWKLTEKDVINSDFALAWKHGTDMYVIVEGGGGWPWTYQEYFVGKLKDGYVVCPYICIVDIDYDSPHPGILNGKLGSENSLGKFTAKEVDYILSNAEKTKEQMLVMFGYIDNDGEKRDTWLMTELVSAGKDVSDNNDVYSTPEQMPEYPGGLNGLMRHIGSNLRYPASAQENRIQGKVVVNIVVEKNGSVTILGTSGANNPDLVKEAKRVVATLSGFTPGKMNGKPVRVKMSLPINFRL